jgi:ketosteroid isomerase-like protein
MSEQDVELVRRICDLHARGDYKAASKLIHKKMPYHHHHGFDDYPDARTYRDYKAIVGYLREFWESWEESEITPAEFIDAGDGRVVALLSFVGRGEREQRATRASLCGDLDRPGRQGGRFPALPLPEPGFLSGRGRPQGRLMRTVSGLRACAILGRPLGGRQRMIA